MTPPPQVAPAGQDWQPVDPAGAYCNQERKLSISLEGSSETYCNQISQ